MSVWSDNQVVLDQALRTMRALELQALVEIWLAAPKLNQRSVLPRIEQLVELCSSRWNPP